jgi:hypothetical protein
MVGITTKLPKTEIRIIESGLFWKVYTQDNKLIFSVFGHKILTIDEVGDVVADTYKKAGK